MSVVPWAFAGIGAFAGIAVRDGAGGVGATVAVFVVLFIKGLFGN